MVRSCRQCGSRRKTAELVLHNFVLVWITNALHLTLGATHGVVLLGVPAVNKPPVWSIMEKLVMLYGSDRPPQEVDLIFYNHVINSCKTLGTLLGCVRPRRPWPWHNTVPSQLIQLQAVVTAQPRW